jgi:hypothetical protein
VTDRKQVRSIPDDTYDVVLIDSPYDAGNVTYSSKLYGTKPLRPYDFVSLHAKKVNIAEKVRLGGVVAILRQLVYKNQPECVRLGVLGITTGPSMRIRPLNLFLRVS